MLVFLCAFAPFIVNFLHAKAQRAKSWRNCRKELILNLRFGRMATILKKQLTLVFRGAFAPLRAKNSSYRLLI
jgi:hypothetical protein